MPALRERRPAAKAAAHPRIEQIDRARRKKERHRGPHRRVGAVDQDKVLERIASFSDEERHEIVGRLRLMAQTAEPDQREDLLRRADQIDAMCAEQPKPVPIPYMNTAEGRDFIERELAALKNQIRYWKTEEEATRAYRETIAKLVAATGEETLMVERVAEVFEDQDRERYPIIRGVDPRAISDSGDTTVPGQNRIRGLGKKSELDHTRAGKKRKEAAWATVRTLDPATTPVSPPRIRMSHAEAPGAEHEMPFEQAPEPVDEKSIVRRAAAKNAKKKPKKKREIEIFDPRI